MMPLICGIAMVVASKPTHTLRVADCNVWGKGKFLVYLADSLQESSKEQRWIYIFLFITTRNSLLVRSNSFPKVFDAGISWLFFASKFRQQII